MMDRNDPRSPCNGDAGAGDCHAGMLAKSHYRPYTAKKKAKSVECGL